MGFERPKNMLQSLYSLTSMLAGILQVILASLRSLPFVVLIIQDASSILSFAQVDASLPLHGDEIRLLRFLQYSR